MEVQGVLKTVLFFPFPPAWLLVTLLLRCWDGYSCAPRVEHAGAGGCTLLHSLSHHSCPSSQAAKGKVHFKAISAVLMR